MTDNTWTRVEPNIDLAGHPAGEFANRAWTKVLYESGRRRFVLYEGYLSGSEVPYTIYSRALWTYDPATNVLALEKVHHWYNGPGDGYDTLPYGRLRRAGAGGFER